jgi:murein L,D-transpeptidase YafK
MSAQRSLTISVLLAGLLLAPVVPRAEPALTSGRGQQYSPVPNQLPTATRVVVRKAARRLELMRGSEVLGSYHISLGLVPTGQKEKAGDFRTPEGRYLLTRRNARSDFFLSIQVSYPGPDDMKRARKNGWDPGGSIMIHGLPNRLKRDPNYYTSDWTDGCIAVSNSDMVEIWLLTHDDTPIDILP